VWLVIAVVADYLSLVKLLNPPAYYKLDVYVYYASTFLIPFLVGVKFGGKGKAKTIARPMASTGSE
jgi:glycine cleavage system pyridoxal-binding protein P